MRRGQRAVARQGHRFPEWECRGTAMPGSTGWEHGPGPCRRSPKGGGVSNPSRSDAELFQSQLGTDATTGPRDGRDNRGVRRSRNQVDSEPRRHEQSRGGPPPASRLTHAGRARALRALPRPQDGRPMGRPKGQRAASPSLGEPSFSGWCSWKHQAWASHGACVSAAWTFHSQPYQS